MSKSFMSEYKLSKPTDVRSNLTSLTLDVGNRGGNALNAKGNVDVTGNAILYGDLIINSGVGQGYGTGKITADSDVSFGGTATIAGNTEIDGTLTTTGVINAQGNIKLGTALQGIGTIKYENGTIKVKTGTEATAYSPLQIAGSGFSKTNNDEHFALDVCGSLVKFLKDTDSSFSNPWKGIKRLGLNADGAAIVDNDVKATLHVTDGDIFTNRGFKDIHGYGSNITQNVRYTLGQNSFGSAQNNFKLGTTDISNSDIFTVFNLNQTIDGSLSPVQIDSNLVDLTDASLSFCGSVFDGRYVYFIPSEFFTYGVNSYKDNNKLIRYDTFIDFSNITSWQVIDLSNDISYNGTSLDLSGSYHGALFDGSAIYFSPFTNTNTNTANINIANKQLLRYDPYYNFRSFGSAESYTSFDSGHVTDTSGGYNGNVYDGRYIYYVPGSATNGSPSGTGNGLDTHSTVLRYDTKSGFANTGSYNVCDLNLAASTEDKGYMGGCFDGQYVYFAPYKKTVISTGVERSFTHGYAVRYNTHSEFSSGNAASWNKFDLSANYATITGLIGSDGIDGGKKLTGYSGCVYDGRYVYYIPYEKSDTNNTSWSAGDFSANTTIARYDTQYNDASFSDVRAWSYYDLTHKFGSLDGGGSGLGLGDKMKGGFFGACYDGQNIWFIPSAAQFADANADKWSSLLVKYDTQQSFIDPSAYIGYDLTGLEGSGYGNSSGKLGGYRGCSFDGRYLYLTPWRRRTGTKDRANGCVMRVDTGAPSQRLGINHLANSKEFFIDSAGKVGIGTNTPDSNYLLDVSGSIAAHGDICGHNFYAQDISARNIYMQDISARNIYISNDISGLDASFHNLSVDRIYTDPAGKTLVIDSSLMITGGNVGVGIAPSSDCTLDISSVFGTGDSSIRLRREGTRHWNIINDSTGAFKIQKLTGGNVSDISDCFAIYKTSGLGNADVNIPGRLKVGMNSDVDASHSLCVNGDICGNNLYIEDVSASNIYVNTIYSNPSAGQALIIDSSLAIPDACFNILSDGNVGIGTTSPSAKLDIKDGALKVKQDTGNNDNCLIINPNNHNNGVDIECFQTTNANTKKAICLNSYGGNVGIGTPYALTRLHIADTTGTECRLRLESLSNTYIEMYPRGHGDGRYMWFGYGSATNAQEGKLQLYLAKGTAKSFSIINTNVGIKTASPYCPLQVMGYSGVITDTGSSQTSFFHRNYTHGGGIVTVNVAGILPPNSTSLDKTTIYGEHNIVAGNYIVATNGSLTVSDNRIKNNIQDIDDSTALNILRQLKPKTYGYNDVVVRGSGEVVGFIAQEVKELIPSAVSISREFLPNIYCLSAFGAEGVVEFDTNKLITGDNLTGRISLRDKNDGEQILEDSDYTVISTGIQVSKDISEYVGDNNEIFVYGQEVNDFNLLKKESIFTVATAALQEVDRQLQAEKAKTATLETKTATLETKTATLETTVADLVARITALENA